MTSHEVLEIFKASGALLEGHFVLRSGLHSRQFFQCALALQYMPVVERLGAALANKLQALQPATVISPAMGGLVSTVVGHNKGSTALIFIPEYIPLFSVACSSPTVLVGCL